MNNLKSWKTFLVQESIDPGRVVYAVIHNGKLMGIFGNKDGAEDKLIEIVIEENPKNIHAYILAKKEIERQFSRNRDHNRVYSPQEEEEIRRDVALGIIRANSGFRYSYDDAIKPVSSFDQLTELLNGDFSSWPGGEDAAMKRFNSLLIRKTMF